MENAFKTRSQLFEPRVVSPEWTHQHYFQLFGDNLLGQLRKERPWGIGIYSLWRSPIHFKRIVFLGPVQITLAVPAACKGINSWFEIKHSACFYKQLSVQLSILGPLHREISQIPDFFYCDIMVPFPEETESRSEK